MAGSSHSQGLVISVFLGRGLSLELHEQCFTYVPLPCSGQFGIHVGWVI